MFLLPGTFLVIKIVARNELKEKQQDLILLCTFCILIFNVKIEKYLMIMKGILIEKPKICKYAI